MGVFLVAEADVCEVTRGQVAYGVDAVDGGDREVRVTPVHPRHLVVNVLDPRRFPQDGEAAAHLPDERHVASVEGDLVRDGPAAAHALGRRDQPVHFLDGPPRWLLDEDGQAALENGRREVRGHGLGHHQGYRIRLLGVEHGEGVGVGAPEAETLGVSLRLARLHVAARGQPDLGMLRGILGLRRPVRAPGMLPAADHAEVHDPS